MKIKINKLGIEAEANVEKIIEKKIESNEKDWKEKIETKNGLKKEMLELKHKHKMEEDNYKRKEDIKIQESKIKKTIMCIGISLFFIYGLFCITGFRDMRILSSMISLVQVVLVIITIFSSANLFSLFKNDYKICLIISLMLIIPWLLFSV